MATAQRVLHKLIAGALAVVLGWLIFQAVQRGVADLHARHVQYQFAKWEKARKAVFVSEWRTILAAAQAAHGLTPANPDRYEDIARLYEWLAFGRPVGHPLARDSREKALPYFRAAARERPVSGYTWANVAQAKLALSAIDEEFARALELSAFLAPWEPEAQLSLADTGLAAWPRLSEGSREIVRGTAARALKRQSPQMVRIAQNRGRMRVLCELPQLPRDVALACR